MATSSSYYLNAPSLGSATAVFTDAALSVCAAEGFYSDGVIVREQVDCVLLPQQSCPTCLTGFSSSVVAETSAAVCLLEETTTYYNQSASNTPGIVGVNDLVFEDADGDIPLAAGFYYAAGSIAGGNEWFQVNSIGVVIAIGMCEVPPINCYVYEYINTTESTTFSFGPYPLCPGPGVFDIQIAPSAEGVTFCIEQLSAEEVSAFNAMGLTLTEGTSICNP